MTGWFLRRTLDILSSYWVKNIFFKSSSQKHLSTDDCVCMRLAVFSAQLSSKHGTPLWKLGQGQAYNHIQSVPF